MEVAFLYPPPASADRPALCPNALAATAAASRANLAAEDAAFKWATCLQHAVSVFVSLSSPVGLPLPHN